MRYTTNKFIITRQKLQRALWLIVLCQQLNEHGYKIRREREREKNQRTKNSTSNVRQPPCRGFMDDLTIMFKPDGYWKPRKKTVACARMAFKPQKTRSMKIHKGKIIPTNSARTSLEILLSIWKSDSMTHFASTPTWREWYNKCPRRWIQLSIWVIDSTRHFEATPI